MLLFFLSTIITHLAAFLYPAYLSYKALKARDARALVHCLQYWAVLGIFSCCELITDTFLFWLPFYYALKLVFVLWLILPFTNGATVIYRTLLHPTLERHEKDIDLALKQVQISAKQTSTKWGRRGFHAVQKVAVDSIAAGLGSTRVESHLSVLSSGGEQVGSLLSSAANALTIPSPRILEILSSDEEEPTSQREGGTLLSSGILPALALGATSLRGDHSPASNEGSHPTSEASREEQYIQSQRAALYKMMDQLDKAEAEVKLNRHHNLRTAAPAPSKKSNLPSISAIGVSASSSVEPLAGPNPIHRRRSRRHVLADVESKSHQPHPPRTTRLPHQQTQTKDERSSKAPETSPATNAPSSSTAISDFDGLVVIGEDLSFTDRELDELGVPAREKPNAPPASGAPSSGHPGSTSQSWFQSLW